MHNSEMDLSTINIKQNQIINAFAQQAAESCVSMAQSSGILMWEDNQAIPSFNPAPVNALLRLINVTIVKKIDVRSMGVFKQVDEIIIIIIIVIKKNVVVK
jgi:hypothetical protein